MQHRINIKRVKLSDLIEDPGNSRRHDDVNLLAIDASLEDFGQVEPLVVQASSLRVIAGNGRLRVMRQRGVEDADVNLLDVDDNEAERLSVILNRSAELGQWDRAALAAIVERAEDAGHPAGRLGFSEDQIAMLMEAEQWSGAGPSEIPDAVPAKVKSAYTVKISKVPASQKDAVLKAVQEALEEAGLPFAVTAN